MKLNKWTIGLAAVGAVSLASVAQAEEKSSTLASLSSTVLSGFVDTSAQWNIGDGVSHTPGYKYGGAAKADGFNLNVVDLTLEKPLDESEWAAGYKAELWLGPDANTLGTQSTGVKADFAIKQAYVALRAPVGNGLDFKIGVFDSVVGYESSDTINNPNFSRSWGHTIEPSEHTGILSTYRVNNMIAFSAGVADTLSPTINGRSLGAGNSPAATAVNESYKTYMGSIALTAPDDWGFVAGSTMYAGLVDGWNGGAGADPRQNYYVGATLNTPVTGLRVGASFDLLEQQKTLPVFIPAGAPPGFGGNPAGFNSFNAHAYALYASYQATEKLSVHGRLEYFDVSPYAADAAQAAGVGPTGAAGGLASSTLSSTGTLQYDPWKNVLSRLELRWDHALDGSDAFGGTTAGRFQSSHFVTGTQKDSFSVAANVVYKF
jgi:hypothetical protein